MAVAGGWRRLGAGASLVLILAAAVLVVGGGVAAVLALSVDDTPAAEQSAAEAAEVTILDCDARRDVLAARIRVTNGSSEPSDCFVDLDFTWVRTGNVIESTMAMVEGVPPGESRPVFLIGAERAPPRYACRLGDVDRLTS